MVGNYVDATFSGDSQDTLEAGAKLYNGVPRGWAKRFSAPPGTWNQTKGHPLSAATMPETVPVIQQCP